MITLHHIDGTNGGVDIVKTLITEYIAELDEDLQFQQLKEELEDPLKKYGPPEGSLVLAYYDGEVAGCVAMQWAGEQTCEMKRLFVRQGFREKGIGDRLIQQILIDGKDAGYTKMVLDTLERLQPAIRLYQKYGFINTSAYYENPLPNVVYMEKKLQE